MNRRGAALIISYMVIGVLTILGAGFIMRAASEHNLVSRHVSSTKAFWLAEAGIAGAIADFPNSPLSGYLGDTNNTYNTQSSLVEGTVDRYRIISVGSVMLPTGSTINRTIEIIVRVPQFGNIDDAITATGNIIVGGAARVNGTIAPFSVLDFAGTFDMTEAQLRTQTDHFYTNPPNNIGPVEGVTWIEISGDDELVISDNLWSGSGILIVNGDLKITGGDFSGILWVNGSLEVSSGNPDIFGAIFVNCGAEDTVILGVAEITHDSASIVSALSKVSPTILSWSEL